MSSSTRLLPAIAMAIASATALLAVPARQAKTLVYCSEMPGHR